MAAIFTNVGVAPDCGLSYFLPRVVSFSNALMMVETAKVFKADDCKQMGLIDELVPEGKAFETAFEYAKMLAQRASVAQVRATAHNLHIQGIGNLFNVFIQDAAQIG